MFDKKIDKLIDKKLKALAVQIDKQYRNRFNKKPLAIIVSQLCTPGKKMRAKLLLASYLLFGNKKMSSKLVGWAVAFEVLQTFILVHDDILDEALQRRSKNSLWHELKLQNVKDPQKIALVAGDLLYTLGIQQFMEINEQPENILAALKYLLQSADKTAVGEIEELRLSYRDLGKINLKEIEKLYHRKTADYSFVSPLVCGALMAGTKKQEIKKLEFIGGKLGIAFQIQDDLLDIYPYKKKRACYEDIKNSRLTWLTVKLFQKANSSNRKFIYNFYAKKTKSKQHISKILDFLDKYQINNAAKLRIEKMLLAANKKIDLLKIRKKEKLLRILTDYTI